MAHVLGQQDLPVEAHSKKRRVMALHEVEEELRAAGLCQPALSAMRQVGRRESSEFPNTKRIRSHVARLDKVKRSQEDQQQPVKNKRHKACYEDIPYQLCPPDVGSRVPTANTLRHAIVPYSSSHFGMGLSPSSNMAGAKLSHIAVDPFGLAFMVSEQGYIFAELPPDMQPVLTLNGIANVKIAKVVIDLQGKAYLISPDGQLLTTVAALPCLSGGGQDAIPGLQMICANPGKHACSKSIVEDEAFSPTTDVPPYSPELEFTEDAESDVDMG